jgi:hypothetical protein
MALGAGQAGGSPPAAFFDARFEGLTAMNDEPATLPERCRKFQRCSAAICPLDPSWRSAVHLSGEPICRYLLAAAKEGAAEHYAGQWEFEAVREKAAAVCAAHPAIAREVQRAGGSGIRGAHRKGLQPGVKAFSGLVDTGQQPPGGPKPVLRPLPQQGLPGNGVEHRL